MKIRAAGDREAIEGALVVLIRRLRGRRPQVPESRAVSDHGAAWR